MIITLEETKGYLRVDGNGEDLLIETLMSAAELYLFNATGNAFDSTNELAKLFCYVMVTDWFENRELTIGKVGEKTRPIVSSMLAQLSHCYNPPDAEVEP